MESRSHLYLVKSIGNQEHVPLQVISDRSFDKSTITERQSPKVFDVPDDGVYYAVDLKASLINNTIKSKVFLSVITGLVGGGYIGDYSTSNPKNLLLNTAIGAVFGGLLSGYISKSLSDRTG